MERETHGGRGGAEVLIVDDDLLFSVRIETGLKRLGYTVTVAGSGAAAFKSASTNPPALAIVNFGNARIPAFEIVQELKAQERPPTILGFVSHTKLVELRPAAKEAGCDLLVANSALALRLPQLAARLAPLDGSGVQV